MKLHFSTHLDRKTATLNKKPSGIGLTKMTEDKNITTPLHQISFLEVGFDVTKIVKTEVRNPATGYTPAKNPAIIVRS